MAFAICPLCGRKITEDTDKIEIDISTEVVEELTRKVIITPSSRTSAIRRHLHKSCIEALDIPTRRRLLLENFTHRLLSSKYGVWVLLDEYGNPKWETEFSDNPEVDQKLKRLRKKFIEKGKKSLTTEELKWLRNLGKYD